MDKDFKVHHSFMQFTTVKCREHFVYLLRYVKKTRLLWEARKGNPS